MRNKTMIKKLNDEISELKLTNKMLYKNMDNLHERLILMNNAHEKTIEKINALEKEINNLK